MLTTIVLLIYQNIVGRKLTEKETYNFFFTFWFDFIVEATIGFYYILS